MYNSYSFVIGPPSLGLNGTRFALYSLMTKAITLRQLDNSNCDALNGLVKNIAEYAIDYNTSVSNSIKALDFPITNEVALIVEEAIHHILPTMG